MSERRLEFVAVDRETGETITTPISTASADTMRTYGHVIEELDDAPRISTEDAIAAARRDEDVRQKCVEIN